VSLSRRTAARVLRSCLVVSRLNVPSQGVDGGFFVTHVPPLVRSFRSRGTSRNLTARSSSLCLCFSFEAADRPPRRNDVFSSKAALTGAFSSLLTISPTRSWQKPSTTPIELRRSIALVIGFLTSTWLRRLCLSLSISVPESGGGIRMRLSALRSLGRRPLYFFSPHLSRRGGQECIHLSLAMSNPHSCLCFLGLDDNPSFAPVLGPQQKSPPLRVTASFWAVHMSAVVFFKAFPLPSHSLLSCFATVFAEISVPRSSRVRGGWVICPPCGRGLPCGIIRQPRFPNRIAAGSSNGFDPFFYDLPLSKVPIFFFLPFQFAPPIPSAGRSFFSRSSPGAQNCVPLSRRRFSATLFPRALFLSL